MTVVAERSIVEFLERLDRDGRLVHAETLPRRAARHAELTDPLPESLTHLRPAYGFWSHQAEAIDHARAGRSVVVAINKWDLLDEESREDLEEDWERMQQLLSNPERVNMSALSGRRLDRLLPAVDRLLERSRIEVGTSELNRIIEMSLRRHQPPQKYGKPWKVYYATQVGTAPPTFMLFANRTLERSDTYRRYLENRIRESLDLGGVPVRLVIRKKDG